MFRYLLFRELKLAFAGFMVFLCIALVMASPSGAVMGAPEDRFTVADQQTVEKLKSVSRVEDLVGPGSTVMVAEIYALGRASADMNSAKRFLALRIEDSSCSVVCPTAIFKDEVGPRQFEGIIFATRFFTYYDRIEKVCEKCGYSVAVLFFADKEVVNEIYIHDTGIIF